MTEIICLRAKRLCLLRDLHNARQRHCATRGIEKRLQAVTARLAAMEARYG